MEKVFFLSFSDHNDTDSVGSCLFADSVLKGFWGGCFFLIFRWFIVFPRAKMEESEHSYWETVTPFDLAMSAQSHSTCSEFKTNLKCSIFFLPPEPCSSLVSSLRWGKAVCFCQAVIGSFQKYIWEPYISSELKKTCQDWFTVATILNWKKEWPFVHDVWRQCIKYLMMMLRLNHKKEHAIYNSGLFLFPDSFVC